MSTLSPSSKKEVTIGSITWNKGNTSASNEAVKDIVNEFSSSDELPTVITISTQEENAKEGERLHEKMLAEINKQGKGTYKLVQTKNPSSHGTFAGGGFTSKKKVGLLSKTGLSTYVFNPIKRSLGKTKGDENVDNRVSLMVLVKEPYDIENADATILKSKNNANKSIITIKGKLIKKDGNAKETLMDISVSGSHLESNKEIDRTNQIEAYRESEGLTSTPKDYKTIVKISKTFREIKGDLNYRDLLMADGSTRQSKVPDKGLNQNENPTAKSIHGYNKDKDDKKIPNSTYHIKLDKEEWQKYKRHFHIK